MVIKKCFFEVIETAVQYLIKAQFIVKNKFKSG